MLEISREDLAALVHCTEEHLHYRGVEMGAELPAHELRAIANAWKLLGKEPPPFFYRRIKAHLSKSGE